MGYLFAIRNLSIEPSIRIRQLQDLQAQYAQEARGKIYYEVQTPPFENTSVPVLKMVKCTPTEEEKRVLDNGSPLASYRIDDEKENSITAQGTMPSVVNQSYAAGDQKGTVRITITDKVFDVKESAIFDPILTIGDNSVTAAKVSKKQSVAARMGKWLRRLFSCTMKPELIN